VPNVHQRADRYTWEHYDWAANPTVEGAATALHIQSVLADTGVTVTRLARGLAPGSQIEFANRAMLEAAFRGRA